MPSLISEIRNSYEKKISALQQEIERLRSKMTIVLSAVQEDIGELEVTVPKVEVTSSQIAKKIQKVDGVPTTRYRIIQAVNRMPLLFGTNDLLRSVNSDGNTRQVNKNRALKIFKDLINEGIVKTEKPHSGKQGGTYKKVIKESHTDPSLGAQAFTLFEEGKGG